MGFYKQLSHFASRLLRSSSTSPCKTRVTNSSTIRSGIVSSPVKNESIERISQSGFSSRMIIFNRIQNFGGRGFGEVCSRRGYYVDRYDVSHFRKRGPQRWFQDRRVVLVVVVVGAGIGISIYFGNTETVPYTHRQHFILLSRSMERQLGESQFDEFKASMRKKILPALHPDSIRVRLIAKDIIDAVKRGIKHEQGWSDLTYAEHHPDSSHGGVEVTRMALTNEEDKLDTGWHKHDEILDDKWVQETRSASKALGSQPATNHLEGLNWEVIVINQPEVNAFCLPGGKIVVFTGLLEHFKMDAEIATVLGHEVGHAIARHVAEQITRNLWFTILQLVVLQFVYMPDLVNAMSNLLLRLPFSRGMEMEADYIGMLLVASAGYDPRIVPGVYEKLGEIAGDSALRNYLSTHPSGKKRAESLRQGKVMEEALTIYRDTLAGRGIEGFL